MIRFKVENGSGKTAEMVAYHRWDIQAGDDVRDFDKVDAKDQFVYFDDGSELLSRVLSFNTNIVRTECGSYKINDIVHCFIPKYPWTAYSGLVASDEHPYVRPYGRQEKALATRLINGEELKVVTARVKMLTLQKLNDSLEQDFGVDERFIAKNIVRLSKGDGMAALGATKVIMNLNNINPDGRQEQIGASGPMFAGLGTVEEAEIVVDDSKMLAERAGVFVPPLTVLRKALNLQ